jgi:hypothetical protein
VRIEPVETLLIDWRTLDLTGSTIQLWEIDEDGWPMRPVDESEAS